MSYTEQINSFADKLSSNTLDYKDKHAALIELCDVLESFLGSEEYAYFLKKLVPILLNLLDAVPISFAVVSFEHKIRNTILEIFHRLVCNDIFAPYTTRVLDQIQKVLKADNEDNGVVCMKVIVNLHKYYKNDLFEKVQPFIDTVNDMYANMNKFVPQTFKDQSLLKESHQSTSHPETPNADSVTGFATSSAESNISGSSNSDGQLKPLAHSMQSFKTLAECPIMMVSLLSSYKQLVNSTLPSFIPKLIEFLQLEVDAQKEARETAAKRNEVCATVSPEIKNRVLYGDFILAQVKAASFLAYIFIRGFSPKSLSAKDSVVPDIIIRLLQDCPSELSAARKELLHATRHILSTPYKSIFLPKLDLLFNEKILLGDGLTAYETLRPLAYSTAADFLHNIRNELTPSQVWKTVLMYSRLLQDNTLVSTVQIMSGKLLLNLLERINKLPNDEARRLHFIIIDAYTNKFATLNREYDSIIKRQREYKDKKQELEASQAEFEEKLKADDLPANTFLNEEEITVSNNEELNIDYIIHQETISQSKTLAEDEGDIEMKDAEKTEDSKSKDTSQVESFTLYDIPYEYPIQVVHQLSTDPLKDAKYLFRTLLNFLKSVLTVLRQTNPPVPSPDYNAQAWNSAARLFSVEEVDILKRLFKQSVLGLRFFQSSKTAATTEKQKVFDIRQPNLPISASKDEKELMEVIAYMFMKIDLSTLNEIIKSEVSFLVDEMINNAPLLHLPHYFLTNEATSSNFLGVILNYLVSKLGVLGDVNAMQSHIFLRLFKLCMLALNLFPSLNEPVLLTHLNKLILKSLTLSTKAKDPTVYFYLIRTLFKSTSGGRFELLFKEILPLLHKILSCLNSLIESARTPQERDIYIELCLTVPVRLASLVPHVKYLMRPIVLALSGHQDLVSQGLRTLELLVDNMTAEYLDPIIEPAIEDIMEALWKHLQPYPYYYVHSHTAVRILGKLGGRNRKFIKPADDLEPQFVLNQRVEALLQAKHSDKDQPLSISTGIDAAITILEDPRQSLDKKTLTHYRINAFKYLSSVLKLFIDAKDLPENYAALIKVGVQTLLKDKIDDEKNLEVSKIKNQQKLTNQEQLAEKLFNVVFYAASIDELRYEINTLIQNICTHFTQLYIIRHILKKHQKEKKFSLDNGEGKVFISEHILLNSISYALSSQIKEVREAGISAIKCIQELSVTLFGSVEKSLNFILLRSLVVVFFHACYDELYYNKSGGVLGLSVLINDIGIPIKWFSRYQVELIRALVFVVRDTPEYFPVAAVDMAIGLIEKIIKGCNEGVKDVAELSSNLVSSLVYDLANANAAVRKVSRDSLEQLAEVTGLSISKIIYPSKSVLLSPIFSKPLRALPFPMQIGNIEAINFWLSLPHEENTFNEEMQRLLLEVLSLVDADDSMLVNTSRIVDYDTREQLAEIRVVCINLLRIVVSKPEYTTNPQGVTRMKILSVLFKTLCSPQTKVIDASHQALKVALAENSKLPRNLLQNGLRPMLMNLADHKRLTVSNLEALARLLVLLISYFKVEIGKKLIDHLKAWASPHTLHIISGQDLDSNPTIQVVSAILNIFHLLPPKALMFIPDILSILDYLEFHLRRCQGSPFRAPVGKFLNRFAKEAFTYYTDHLNVRQTKFAYFIHECPQLRDLAKESLNALFESLKNETNETTKAIKFANIVDAIYAISESHEGWIKDKSQVINDLYSFVKELIKTFNQSPQNKPYHFQLAGAIYKFQHLLIQHLASTKNIELVFSFLQFACEENVKLSETFEDFLFNDIIKSEDVTFRQEYLTNSINLFLDSNVSYHTKVYISKRVFHPILIFENVRTGTIKTLCTLPDKLSIAAWLNLVHTKIWKTTNSALLGQTAGEVDQYRMELLQMTSVLISMAKGVIENLRKDVIKFSWSLIRIDDAVTKHAAYLASCYFINAYATPIKIRTHMLVALLRVNNNDIKYLVKKALDLLAPVMSATDDKNGTDNSWLKFPRRVISENGYAINNIVNVYKFIVQHKDLFFQARDHFIGVSITAMGKLTLLQNPSPENQSLAMDIAELILYWEKKAKELRGQEIPKKLAAAKNKEVPFNSGSTAPELDASSDYSTSLTYEILFGQKEAFITFLIRYVCIRTQRLSSGDLGKRALAVLHELLGSGYWPEVIVKLSFFNKFLIEPDFSSGNNNILCYCINSLEVLRVALGHKSSEWIIENLTSLQELLEKSIRSDNHDVQEALQKVLQLILRAIKEESEEDSEFEPEEIKNFLNLLTNVISDDLGNTSSLAAGVNLCWTVANYKPERLNPLFPNIMKTFGKLCKDHVTIINQSNNLPEQQAKQAEESKMTTKLLEKILCFAAMRISYLGDQRRIYLSLLAQLIEKTSDYKVLSKVLNIVYRFIFTKENLFPTSKEKAAILGKMMGFEGRKEVPQTLTKNFYKIIVKIFEDDTFAYSDLTQRLEQPFLIGTRFADVGIRKRLMSLLNESIEDNIEKRLFYIIKEQNWDYLADYPWLVQATELLFGAFNLDQQITLSNEEYKFAPLDYLKETITFDQNSIQDDSKDENIARVVSDHRKFLKELRSVSAHDIIDPLIEVLRVDIDKVNTTWQEIFPVAYKNISSSSKIEFARCFAALVAKDYHLRQAKIKPNVIQGLLAGAEKCQSLQIPPHLIKYLGATFDAHYSAMHMISKIMDSDNPSIKEAAENAYCEILSKLEESDMFYGLWRRRAKYNFTNSALSYEQIGVYGKALKFYEAAQIKARAGFVPYSESEYSLWEDNWISCAEKLQHWDVLTELAKHENYTDLLLECGWRVANWNEDKEPLEQSVRTVLDVPTARRQIFQTFLCLQGFSQQERSFADLLRCCDEGIQLSLSKWFSLPERPTMAHTSLLHLFQQYVEFNEASRIYNSLITANTQNMELKSQELKRVLLTWRERLPNLWDDINIWNDISTQRLHAYNLLSILNRPFLGSSNGNMYAFRGYHETAYIINRFAHVARKHSMPDVCISQLTKIYTLPNIEISEAFIKLTEQAKCHYSNVTELNTGLDVISNTNLAYFGPGQKAEFFTLKGMFQAKLNVLEEANQSYATAVQLDSRLPNAWAEWGYFNYALFKKASVRQPQNPQQIMKYAGNALTCFLNAAGLYKNDKARKCLALILYLISLDDQNGTLTAEFNKYKGEVPVWYWITYIPQLLTSLSHREAKVVKNVLALIAKTYPQALHFPLRTTKEDFVAIQRQIAAQSAGTQPATTSSNDGTPVFKDSKEPEKKEDFGKATQEDIKKDASAKTKEANFESASAPEMKKENDIIEEDKKVGEKEEDVKEQKQKDKKPESTKEGDPKDNESKPDPGESKEPAKEAVKDSAGIEEVKDNNEKGVKGEPNESNESPKGGDDKQGNKEIEGLTKDIVTETTPTETKITDIAKEAPAGSNAIESVGVNKNTETDENVNKDKKEPESVQVNKTTTEQEKNTELLEKIENEPEKEQAKETKDQSGDVEMKDVEENKPEAAAAEKSDVTTEVKLDTKEAATGAQVADAQAPKLEQPEQVKDSDAHGARDDNAKSKSLVKEEKLGDAVLSAGDDKPDEGARFDASQDDACQNQGKFEEQKGEQKESEKKDEKASVEVEAEPTQGNTNSSGSQATLIAKSEAKLDTQKLAQTPAAASDAKTKTTPQQKQRPTPEPKKSGSIPASKGTGQPWEYVEEIMLVSKTSYPLLALSLELLVDQITQRFKSSADEDAYRLVVALLNDGIQSYNRMVDPSEDTKLPQQMENNIARFAGTVLPRMIRVEFEKDLIQSKPNFLQYISKLLKWRERLENKLDRRFNKVNLENLCPHLTEFHYQKFEDIELPGQYLLNKDTNRHFVKIDRFLPTLEVVRGYTSCFKKLRIRGTDGSLHEYSVQFPSNRHSRREERTFQMFRLLNGVLEKKVQARSRNIQLTVPIAVALSPHIRILKTENDEVSLHKIYEQYCLDKNQRLEEPFFYTAAKLRQSLEAPNLAKPDLLSLRTEVFSAIQSLYVPRDILYNYSINAFPKYEDFWLFRKNFTSQYASFMFMTYMMSINARQPHKIHISLNSGTVYTSEMLPSKTNNVTEPWALAVSLLSPQHQRKAPVIHNSEPVPFRLSPNVQCLIGEIGLEGILSVYMLVMAQSVTEPHFALEHYLNLFVRDEIVSWFAQHLRTSAQGAFLREIVRVNTDLIVAKLSKIASNDAVADGSNPSADAAASAAADGTTNVAVTGTVATAHVNELIAQAVNPRNLAQLDSLWRAYL